MQSASVTKKKKKKSHAKWGLCKVKIRDGYQQRIQSKNNKNRRERLQKYHNVLANIEGEPAKRPGDEDLKAQVI